MVAASNAYVHYQQKIDTLRLLSDKLEMIDADDGSFFLFLFHGVVPSHLEPTGNGPIAEWAAGYYSSQLISFPRHSLNFFAEYHPLVQKALVGTIVTLPDFERESYTICSAVQDAHASYIQILLNIGLNPHFVVDRFEVRGTLTSLAMSSSGAFDVWRTELKSMGTNFEDFVQEEMKLGVLSEMGWTRKSLFTLFDEGVVVPDSRGSAGSYCRNCQSWKKLFEPAWRIELDKIRRDEGM